MCCRSLYVCLSMVFLWTKSKSKEAVTTWKFPAAARNMLSRDSWLLMSYTTPFHTSCVAVRWKMCTTYRASFQHILKRVIVCFSSPAVTNAFNISIFEREFSYFFRGVCLGCLTLCRAQRPKTSARGRGQNVPKRPVAIGKLRYFQTRKFRTISRESRE